MENTEKKRPCVLCSYARSELGFVRNRPLKLNHIFSLVVGLPIVSKGLCGETPQYLLSTRGCEVAMAGTGNKVITHEGKIHAAWLQYRRDSETHLYS